MTGKENIGERYLVNAGEKPNKCRKCGREIAKGLAFCEDCLAEIEFEKELEM